MLADTRKVFIVYSHALFAQGVSSLLSKEPGLQVIGMDSDRERAADRIRELRPDVVVVDGDRAHVELLQVVALILDEMPMAKLISISLDSNRARLLKAEQLSIIQPEDLVQAIHTV